MNIVKVSGHACVRCTKEAIALSECCHEKVHMIAKKIPSGVEIFTSFSLALGYKHYIDIVKIYDNTADIWHCHNEPSWFVTMIKEISKKPVILDVHDSYLTRLTEDEYTKLKDEGKYPVRIIAEERNNFQLADGLVFCAEQFGKEIRDEFKLTQPFTTLYSHVNRKHYQYRCQEHYGGLVYEGKVELPKTLEKHNHANVGFKYADYRELAQKCKDLGVDFHLYTPQNDKQFFELYGETALIHESEWYEDLLGRLTRHDWGLVGNIFPTKEWAVAMPNKLFEYVAACVPVCVINAQEAGEYVRKMGIGIEVSSIEELCMRWAEHRQIRQNLIRVRQELAMENHIHKLTDLYRQFV